MKSLLFVAAFLAMALAAPQEQAASGPNAEAMADLMDMVTMARDLLMRPPLLNLAPTPLLKLTRGTDTTVMPTGLTAMATTVTDMATMVTMERDLLMRPALLNLAPTPMPRLTRGTDITVMPTGLTVMVTTGTDHTATPTGDKKWTSRTTSDLSLPADSSVKRQFLQNNFLFTLLKNSFVLCIRVPGTVFNYLQSRKNKNPQ